MLVKVDEEVRKVVARCIATGHLLFLSDQARIIAAKTNADLRRTENDLLTAAISARVNISFGQFHDLFRLVEDDLIGKHRRPGKVATSPVRRWRVPLPRRTDDRHQQA